MELQAYLASQGLTQRELAAMLNSAKGKMDVRTYHHEAGKIHRIGIISDTHIGHKKFSEPLMANAGAAFRRERVDAVYHVGDITEGMSGRPGHVYELSQIGFQQQTAEAERLFKTYFRKLDIYAITGNHDDWYVQKNNAGANVGRHLEARLENFHYLGENEADVRFGNVTMKLFHPNDGTAYATSYKLQKLIESFGGGEKPNLLFSGHYHKAMYMFCRNVHAFESGTICGQSWFMRGKKIPAHLGFWIVEFERGKNGIQSIKPVFYPAYD